MAQPIWVLMAVYAVSNTLHFAINAELIPFYPYMPGWMRPDTVHHAWLAINAVGLLAMLAAWRGQRALACALLALYGLMGLDGLLHYAMDLCTEHTLITHMAILGTAASGVGLTAAALYGQLRRISVP